MPHIFVVAVRKTRQPVGWKHWRIWYRTVNSGDHAVIFRGTFNHYESAENDNTISTVHGTVPYPTVFPTNWLTNFLDRDHEDVRHPIHLSSLYFFSFHTAMSFVKLHMGNEARQGRRMFVMRYMTQLTKVKYTTICQWKKTLWRQTARIVRREQWHETVRSWRITACGYRTKVIGF